MPASPDGFPVSKCYLLVGLAETLASIHGLGARLGALVCGRERPVGPVDPVAHTSGEGSFLVRG